HEGSKNFATRQRRRAVQDLVRAGMGRRVSSRGPGSVGSGSPVSEGEITFNLSEDEMGSSASSVGAIGSERESKRGSQGSFENFDYDTADTGFKAPPTPASDGRRKMMLGMLTSSAEKRKSSMF
ncbi:hypothetical protein LTR66_003880, partial [Elasticomyces elasticus]